MKALEDYKNINIKNLKLNPEGFIEVDGQRLFFELANYGYTKNRPFFICPKCNKRRIKLYFKDSIWACHKCHGLIYKSSLTSPKQRAISNAIKIRTELEDKNIFNPFPEKPPKMQWRRYFQLRVKDTDIKRSCGKLLLRGEI